MTEIHKPRLMRSDLAYDDTNQITQKIVTDTILIATEYWTNEPKKKFVDAGVATAKKGFKWITRWELGKNYIATEIFDEKGVLVGVYWDITSPIEKVGDQYQAYDWYLDVFKIPNEKAVLLDSEELDAALEAGFLTEEEVKTSKEAASRLLRAVHN